MISGKSSFLICFSFGTFFLLLLDPINAENRTEPRKNDNLSPFESWRSAYFCMLNTSSYCWRYGHTLQLNGVLNVDGSDIKNFCEAGCYQHTLAVLSCIEDVKRDFFFVTKQNVSYVRNATNTACASKLHGFNTNVTRNSATSLYGRFYMAIVSTVTTMAFLATFGV